MASATGEGSKTTVRRHRRLQTFSSLGYRDYRLLWFGTLFSSSGQWIQQATLSWLTYQMTGSPFLLGAINGVRSLPILVFSPFGGVAADRVDRKKLMLGTQLWIMVVSAAFATIIVSGRVQVWHLFAFTLFTGMGWAFNMPVRQSIVPRLVPREELSNALALNSAGFNATRILGPTAAGILIALLGPGENFYLQSAAYLGVVWMVFLMNVPTIPKAAAASLGANLREGAAYIWKHPTLRTQMSLALVPVVVSFPYTSLMPIFAKDVLNVGSAGFGMLMSAPGIGAVIGTLILASMGESKHKGFLLLGNIFSFGVLLVLFSLVHIFFVSLLILVFVGATQMVYMTTNQTLLQISAPDEMRGRVMGIFVLNQGLLPLGSLLAGSLSDVFNAPFAVLLMGSATCLLAFAFFWKARSLRTV